MVFLWPWRAPDNSPASFEKTLSGLSEKIALSNSNLELHRQRARRFKALWTLYTTFAYILYALIAALVLGWKNWGPWEYTALAGSPLAIYTVRRIGAAFYQYRVANTQKYLDELLKQRDGTIEKLKEATRYNSTLQLLEKYGSESPKTPQSQKGIDVSPSGNINRKDPQFQASVLSAGKLPKMTPPPTANIPRAPFIQPPGPPGPSNQDQNRSPSASPSGINPHQYQHQNQRQPIDEPGFHPSAFSTTQHIEPRQPQWYDRILDVLLGEDETLPKNRLALICVHCRLVNGQAAPAIRTIEEIGRWRCVGCGGWNGAEDNTTHPLSSYTLSEGLVKPSRHNRSKSVSHIKSLPTLVVEPASPIEADNTDKTPDGSGDSEHDLGNGNEQPDINDRPTS